MASEEVKGFKVYSSNTPIKDAEIICFGELHRDPIGMRRIGIISVNIHNKEIFF